MSSPLVPGLCPRKLPASVTCIVLLFLGATPLCAQSTSDEREIDSVKEGPTQHSPPGPWVPSFRTIGQDALDIVRAPVTLSRSQRLLTLGASGVVFGAVSALDRPVHRRVSVQSGTAADVTAPLAAPGRWYDRLGPDRMALGTAAFLAASGLALERRDFTRTSVRVLEAVLYTKVVTGFAKGLFSRSRPVAGANPFTADPAAFESEHAELSMPSGHTARAFAIASVLAHQADRWYVSVLSYGGAASVGLERIRSGDHWLTDVAVGGTLGYLIGRSVASSEAPRAGGVTYTPILSADRVGLSIRF